jgi:23S rRNA (cytosine1962-C5)-methyltransferase
MEAIRLKKGKEKILAGRHHWIFSGAIADYPADYQDGTLAPIQSHTGEILGHGFFNRKTSLAGRIVSFGRDDPYLVMERNLDSAIALRHALLHSKKTTACRLLNGEGDGFPGLIIDKYGPYLVTQTGALGMRLLLPFFIEALKKRLPLQGIFDKSKGGSIQEEQMEPREEILWGELPDLVEILENGIRYRVALKTGQKTGFFLDQREMRHFVSELAQNKRVLNGFCYTGGFTLAALTGGAVSVDSVDISAPALELCQSNLTLNGFHQSVFKADLFDFLNEHPCAYDLIILDPPAFAKKKKDLPAAIKGYQRLFTLALQKIPPSAYLLLSSCSHYVSESLFERIVQTAALNTHRSIRIIGRHRLASDHPVNPFHPESAYLKSLLLFVA